MILRNMIHDNCISYGVRLFPNMSGKDPKICSVSLSLDKYLTSFTRLRVNSSKYAVHRFKRGRRVSMETIIILQKNLESVMVLVTKLLSLGNISFTKLSSLDPITVNKTKRTYKH